MKVVAICLVSVLGLGMVGVGSTVSPGVLDPGLDQSQLTAAVLSHPQIHLLPGARSDVERGLIDPRVLRLLLVLADQHELTKVGPLISGHSYYVKGTTRPSYHAFGRAVDILAMDGEWVTIRNLGALDATRLAVSLEPPLRPHQVGAPWTLSVPGVTTFTKDHADHLHFGYAPGKEDG